MKSRSIVTARVLRDGVAVSFALLLAGTIAAIATGDGRGTLIQAGLILLLLTPFARMVVLIYEFARDRESAFVAISLGVLLLMFISIMIGMQ